MANPVINTGTSVTGVSRGESLDEQENAKDKAVGVNSGGDNEAADTISSSPNTNRSGSGGVNGALEVAKIVSGGSLGGGGGGGGGAGGGSQPVQHKAARDKLLPIPVRRELEVV